MPERRQSQRRTPASDLYVVDKQTDQPLGSVQDLNSGGCKLLCREPIAAGKLFQCRLALPEPILEITELALWLESKWCVLDEGDGMFEVGFEFRDLTESDKMILKFLIVPWDEAREAAKAAVADPMGRTIR